MLTENDSIKVIPHTSRNYICLEVKKFRFIDAIKHLNASLSAQVDSLVRSKHNFPILQQFFPDKRHMELLCQKQILPYSYFDCEEKFEEKEIPPIECFYNDLTGEHLSETNYEHVKKMFNVLGLKTLGEYHDTYLLLDVILLAENFELYRFTTLRDYELDPVNYLTLPSLSLDCCLKYTNCEIDLIDDYSMYLFINKSVRGGFSTVPNRFDRANNPSFPETYDSSKPIKNIHYLDFNQLYPSCMTGCLPVGGYRWLSDDEKRNIDFLAQTEDQPLGYFVECCIELKKDKRLHNLYSDYPFPIEKKYVSDSELSAYSLELRQKLCYKEGKSQKLIGSLQPKKDYKCHYLNLKYYLENGYILTKLGKVLEFQQKPVFKEFIEFNTNKRRLAKTDVERNFYKLFSNSIFGKMLQNNLKFFHMRLVHTEAQINKLVAKSNFKKFHLFQNNLVGIEYLPTKVVLKNNIACGATILEKSKLMMYKFWYNNLLIRYSSQHLRLLVSDTDSFIFSVIPHLTSFIDDIQKNEALAFYDTSNFPKDHPLFSDLNCKALGKMKFEFMMQPISEVVALKSKMYSIKFFEGGEKMACKGVSGSCRKTLRHQDFKKCLMDEQLMYQSFKKIESIKHQLFTLLKNKLSLNCYESKRYFLNKVDSLPFGHYKIEEGNL